MSDTWSSFLREPAPADHAVQVYDEVGVLARSVADYLAAGFAQGQPAIVIARPAHRRVFGDALADRGWSEAAIEESGLLCLADAGATVAAIDGGAAGPSRERFAGTIGGLLDRVGARFPGRPVRVFGELVDLLVQAGDLGGARELEELWNRLVQTRDLSLLCAYQVDLFDRASQISVLPDLCRAHSHVRPADDVPRFRQAVEAALEGALGRDAGKVYALVAEEARARQVPEAQLALMWVSEHMPSHAERILAAARTEYRESCAPVLEPVATP